MNLLNLIENTTGGYDNLRALLQAVNTRSDAQLNIGGEPITLDYMEANFLNGLYKAYLRAGRQEEFIQDLGDARRFDLHMKKLRNLIDKQKNFRGSVPGERGVTGDVPVGAMEGIDALEEISMQDPNNPSEQTAGKLNWTRMVQDYMANKPYTEFEFGKDRPLTIYRTQIYAILKAFGGMKPPQKLNIILNTFGNKLATVEYLDRLRAKGMMPKKVPAYVSPDVEPVPPGQMDLPGMATPRIKEATAQKKSPRELGRDSAVSAKVQRAFQLARARQPAAASDIEAFVRDEIERGEEMAQQVAQLQADNEQQSQQIEKLTKAVAQQPAPTEPTPPAPAAEKPRVKKEPKTEPRADKDVKSAEKPAEKPAQQPVPTAEPAPQKPQQDQPVPGQQPTSIPAEVPDNVLQFPGTGTDGRRRKKIGRKPDTDAVGAALSGLDELPIAVGQNESHQVRIRGNALFEGRMGTVKNRINDDFFMVTVEGFGDHAFHVSRLVFEMQTKIDRFNIHRPILPSGAAKIKYAQDHNMYDDARIQEALPDKAMAVLQKLKQPEPIELNVPDTEQPPKSEYQDIKRRIAQLDELIRMKEMIDKLFLKAQNVRGGIYPGLQADIENEELYPVPQTDREYQELRDKYSKDLAALKQFLTMKKSVYREDEELVSESTALVRLKQARQQLANQGLSESLRPGEYHVATVTLDNGDVKKFKVTFDEGYTEAIKKFYAKQGRTVTNIDMDWSVQGDFYEAEELDEKQDACYHKVRSRYKVWPSAYASGALVQCRKKGADNWGEGGKKK